jgi:hypothetical protein
MAESKRKPAISGMALTAYQWRSSSSGGMAAKKIASAENEIKQWRSSKRQLK